MPEFLTLADTQKAAFQHLASQSNRIRDLLGKHKDSRTGLLACLDDLLGSVYIYATHLEYSDRLKPLTEHDMGNVAVRASDMGHCKIRTDGKWAAGVFFNNALFRLAGIYHRVLKIAVGRPTSGEYPISLLPDAEESFKSARNSDWKHTEIQAIYQEVTDLKHTAEGVFEGRSVQFVQAMDAVDQVLTLVEALCTVEQSDKDTTPPSLWVAGVDGCHSGWVAFKVELPSLITSVEVIDLPALLRERPPELAYLGIDIPIGLLDSPRACDKSARKLLGQPRGTSVFPAPCRASLAAKNHAEASEINRQKTGGGLSRQAFGIGTKIKQVDDAITAETQQWAFEVHPEVCFWVLNGQRPMAHNKETTEGKDERISLLAPIFPKVERHIGSRPSGVGKDDVLDAAAAAWTALRRHRGEAKCVCAPEHDDKGLELTIWY